MIDVSDAWKDIQQRLILPETFVEISCTVTDASAQVLAQPTGINTAFFARASVVTGTSATTTSKKYATFERNLWVLDGSRQILPDSGPYSNTGYASSKDLNDAAAGITLNFPTVQSKSIPGITITWSSEYDEYPTAFAVYVKNGAETVSYKAPIYNYANVSVVDLDISNYDEIEIIPLGWCLPDHRVRIDRVMLGHVMTFGKDDIISFTHEQYGHINSGELSENKIEFSLVNTDGRWNPNNPTGIEKYLSERQRIVVKYGLDVGGEIEWIKAGTFYLSDWHVPSNGLEASFAARDVFEYMLNTKYTSPITTGTLSKLISIALTSSFIPDDFVYNIDSSLESISATLAGDYTTAEVLQMCANAGRCVVRQDRNGELYVEPLNRLYSGYVIGSALSYSHPEITLSKQLKSVAVSFGSEQTYNLSVETNGETQTVDNPLVSTEDQAKLVAEWVRDMLISRKTVNGEFRADPRLDLFDIVAVESKYGTIMPVVITHIKYSYSGSFRAEYTGRVLPDMDETEAVLGQLILGVSVLGQGG